MNAARFAALLALSGSLILAGCSASDTPALLGMTNEELERAVTRELSSDPRIPVSEIAVTADATDRKVVLSGVLMTEADRNRVVAQAKRTRPDVVIIDRIGVIPPDASRNDSQTENAPRGVVSKDAYIYSAVIAGLTAGKDTSVRDIHVDVDGQVVTLRGSVASPQVRQEAQRIAADTAGVKAVRNFLTIRAG